MKAPIIIGVISDWVLGFSVTAGSFVVKISVKSKNVVSVPSVQDIVITYPEVVVTSPLEFSVKIREASANEYTSNKMKNTKQIPQCGNNSKIHVP